MTGTVVKEFPVILTKSHAKELYVFEYPLKNKESTDFLHNVFNARIKPQNQMVEMDVTLDQNGPHYNKMRGRDIADGMSEGTSSACDDGPMLDKIVYRSDPVADQKLIRNRMGILYRRGNKLYLSPLAGMSTILPTMDHMERKSTIQEPEKEEDAQLRAVNFKFGRAQTEASKARRDNRYSAWKRRIDTEPWIQCQFTSYDEDGAESLRAALRNVQDEASLDVKGVKFVDNRAFLDLVAPKANTAQSKEVKVTPSNTVSLSQLKLLPLEQQVKVLMTNAKVMRFARLVETLRFAGSSESDVQLTNVLQAVQENAVLVHACWVVKSEILYPENTFSAHSGVPRDLLVRGRDFILWKFTQNCAVTRKEISSTIKLPTEEVTEIMQQIARQRRPLQTDQQSRHRRRKWEFIFDDDKEFARRYPEIVEAQEKMWEARFQQLCSALRLDHARIVRDSFRKSLEERRHSRRYSSSSDMELASPEHAARRRRRTRSASSGGSSPAPGRSRNRSRSSSESHSPLKLPSLAPPGPVPMEVDTVDGEPSLTAASCGVEFPSEEFEKFARDFVHKKLTTRLVVPLSEIASPFRLHLPKFGAMMDNERLDKLLAAVVMIEGGMELKVAAKPAATRPKDRLFATRIFHEAPLQGYRDILLQAFADMPGLTFAQYRQRVADVEKISPKNVDDSMLRKIIKMYCTFKGKHYYLKWTLDAE